MLFCRRHWQMTPKSVEGRKTNTTTPLLPFLGGTQNLANASHFHLVPLRLCQIRGQIKKKKKKKASDWWKRGVCNWFNASINLNVKDTVWNFSAFKGRCLNSWIFLVFPCLPNAHQWLCVFFSLNHPEMRPFCSTEKQCSLWLFFFFFFPF